MSPLAYILEGVRAAVRSFFDDIPEAEGQRIRLIARELCQADGHDPDAVTMMLPKQAPMYGAKGTIMLCQPLQPQWVLYFDEARVAIAAVEKYDAK